MGTGPRTEVGAMHVDHYIHIRVYFKHVAIALALAAGIRRASMHRAIEAGDDGLDLLVVGPCIRRVHGYNFGLARYTHIGLEGICGGQCARILQHAKCFGKVALDLSHEGDEISALVLRCRHDFSLRFSRWQVTPATLAGGMPIHRAKNTTLILVTIFHKPRRWPLKSRNITAGLTSQGIPELLGIQHPSRGSQSKHRDNTG